MALQLTTHMTAVHGGQELAETVQLNLSEEDYTFCTASEAIENHSIGVLASPTLEARPCSSSSSSSSQFVSAYSVSSLQSLGSSHLDNKFELEIQASEVHWKKVQLEPCSSNSKLRSNELEQEIEASKAHWSELSSLQSWSSESSDGETNQSIFQKMRQNPLYQDLFRIDFVDLLVGEKIAEGGQAEIFELDYCRTRFKNINGELEWFDLELPCVLKVFKAGYSLHDLQSQWPQGMLKRNYNKLFADLSDASGRNVGHISTSDSNKLLVDSSDVSEMARGPISTSDWRDPPPNSMHDLQSEWPQGLLQRDYNKLLAALSDASGRNVDHISTSDSNKWLVDSSDASEMTTSLISTSNWRDSPNSEYFRWSRLIKPNFEFRSSIVVGGVVLEDDRFAFVLQREGVDLRKLIDVFQDERSVEWEPKNRMFGEYLTFHPQRSSKHGIGPVFKRRVAYGIIYQIALGMRELHRFDILHRDLKASNVLANDVQVHPKFGGKPRSIQLKVADYECSVGVVGTGFWRAPEILQQLKDPLKRKHPIQFTREADVYSFAMTCYEVLTGSLPLEEYATHDFDVVLGGIRPSLPEHIPNWLRNLITSCWQHTPSERPTFEEIVQVIKDELTPFAYRTEHYVVL